MNRKCDVLILTALPVEYAAIRKLLTGLHEFVHPQGTVYEVGTLAQLSVAIAQIGAGNESSAAEAERGIATFAPLAVAFVGVAGGIKDVAVGDVVVGTKIYGYESGKATNRFEPRPEVGHSSYRLIQRARLEAVRGDWATEAQLGSTPSVFVGPIAAGAKVVASRRSPVFRFIRSTYGDALAVEMEGRGMLLAAAANEGVQALVVRGISDLIDGKAAEDASGSQLRASAAAAAFTARVLIAGVAAAPADPADELLRAAPVALDSPQPVSAEASTLTASPRELSPAATDLLLEIAASNHAQTPFRLPREFSRASRSGTSPASKELHTLLRELRSRDLVRPLEGGKWEAGESVVLTTAGATVAGYLDKGDAPPIIVLIPGMEEHFERLKTAIGRTPQWSGSRIVERPHLLSAKPPLAEAPDRRHIFFIDVTARSHYGIEPRLAVDFIKIARNQGRRLRRKPMFVLFANGRSLDRALGELPGADQSALARYFRVDSGATQAELDQACLQLSEQLEAAWLHAPTSRSSSL